MLTLNLPFDVPENTLQILNLLFTIGMVFAVSCLAYVIYLTIFILIAVKKIKRLSGEIVKLEIEIKELDRLDSIIRSEKSLLDKQDRGCEDDCTTDNTSIDA